MMLNTGLRNTRLLHFVMNNGCYYFSLLKFFQTYIWPMIVLEKLMGIYQR